MSRLGQVLLRLIRFGFVNYSQFSILDKSLPYLYDDKDHSNWHHQFVQFEVSWEMPKNSPHSLAKCVLD